MKEKIKKIRCPYCGSEKIYYNDYVGVYHCRNCKGDTLEPIEEKEKTDNAKSVEKEPIPKGCKKDCVYRDPKAKYMPACRFGGKLIIEAGVCKSYVKEPV